MRRLLRFLDNSPRGGVLLLAVLLACLIAWGDYLSGLEITLLNFYALPIAVATWYVGAGWGAALAGASVTASLAADFMLRRSAASRTRVGWELMTDLVAFLLFVWILDRLRKAFDREARVRRETERAAALKSDIISFVSHEIANSVTIAKMSLHLLNDARSDPEASARAKEMLGHSLDNMEVTTNNFLNEARMEAGKLRLTPTAVPLKASLEKAARTFQPLAQEKGLHVVLEAPPAEVFALADEAALALVLNNLVGNAVKYTPERGHIAVKAALEGARPGHVRLIVQDTGIGIPPQDVQRLTEGFVRLPQGKMMARGYGLGLKVVWDMLRLHGSELRIESRPGEGSVFSFDLPLARPKTR